MRYDGGYTSWTCVLYIFWECILHAVHPVHLPAPRFTPSTPSVRTPPPHINIFTPFYTFRMAHPRFHTCPIHLSHLAVPRQAAGQHAGGGGGAYARAGGHGGAAGAGAYWVWRGVEGCGGVWRVWRGVEGCGGMGGGGGGGGGEEEHTCERCTTVLLQGQVWASVICEGVNQGTEGRLWDLLPSWPDMGCIWMSGQN